MNVLVSHGARIREVRLIVGVHAGHQFDVWAVVIRQTAVPRITELVIAPRPLLLPRRDVMIGDMNHAGLGPVIVAAKEILLGARHHVARRDGNIRVPTEVVWRITTVRHKLASAVSSVGTPLRARSP